MIFASVLKRSLDCAIQLKNTQDVINVSLALCSPDIPIPRADKETIQSQLIYTLHNLEKFSLPPLSSTYQLLIIKYRKYSLLHVNCQFDQRNIHTNSPVLFRVQVKSLFPIPIRFKALSVKFNNSLYDVEITDDAPGLTATDMANITDDNLILIPNNSRIFEFEKKAESKCDLMVKFKICFLKTVVINLFFLFSIISLNPLSYL